MKPFNLRLAATRLLAPFFIAASALPCVAQSDAAVEVEKKRLDVVVRELDQLAKVEAAFAAAREVMQEGPVKVKLADQAVLALPKGFVWVPSAEAAAILRVWGNRSGTDLLGMAMPGDDRPGNWFAVIHFNPSGHIKDDDAKNWNADALLQALKAGAAETNKERRTRGGAEMEVTGWIEKPRYNATTHQLVWSLAARASGANPAPDKSVNYNTYTLGREGYISMNLVADPRQIEAYKTAINELLAGLSFRDGKRYGDFNAATDKLADHGVTALVARTAAAPAAASGVASSPVSGFFASFWKPIAIGGPALACVALVWIRRRRANHATPSTEWHKSET